jgi:hypothetical protein
VEVLVVGSGVVEVGSGVGVLVVGSGVVDGVEGSGVVVVVSVGHNPFSRQHR